MDIFGFKNQGINYDKFRPRYPASILAKSLESLSHKNRFLDIATGTGIILFALAPHFTYSLGTDISPTMIKTAQQVLLKEKVKEGSKIQLKVQDVKDLNQKQNYDLITIGQALHFMDKLQVMNKISSILAPGGKFVVFGYVINKIQSENPKEDDYFNEFYLKIKPHFTFDRDDLHTHYSSKQKYPFQKVFPNVKRSVQQVPLELNKQQYLSYLKTMSGYNLYLQKFKEDPITILEGKCADEVVCLLDYFKIECSL